MSIRAGCVLIAPSSAGVPTTSMVGLTRPTANMLRWLPATGIRAGCVLIAPSSAGATTTSVGLTRPTASTPRLLPGVSIRAGCVLIAPSSAGVPTSMVGLTRPTANMLRWPPAGHILAGYAPTTRSSAGAKTGPAKPAFPTANTLQWPLAEPHSCGLRTDNTIVCWGGTGGLATPPNGQVQRGGRRLRSAFLRAAHRQHGRLLRLTRFRGLMVPRFRGVAPLTWISGATAMLFSWWILSYSIGFRIPRAVWRRFGTRLAGGAYRDSM